MVVVLVIFLIESRGNYNELRSDFDSVTTFTDKENDQLINSTNLLAQEVSEMNQNLLSSDEEIRKLSEELSKYKSIQSHVKAEILSEIRGIELPMTIIDREVPTYISDSTFIHRDTISKYFTPIPSKVSFNDEWITFNATVGKSFTLDSLSMINKFDVTIGSKKEKWYNKSEPVVTLNSYSPYSSIPYVNNLVVEEPKGKILKKAITYAGIFTAGMLTNQLRK